MCGGEEGYIQCCKSRRMRWVARHVAHIGDRRGTYRVVSQKELDGWGM
jgi:hypothetical protein